MFETRMKNLFYGGDRHLPITTYFVNKYLNNYSEPRVTIKVPYYPSSLITSLQTNHENKFRRVMSEAQNLKRVYNINGQNPTQYRWFEEEKKVNENQDHKSQKIKNQEKQVCDWRKFKRLM